jgi:hypothetical protein
MDIRRFFRAYARSPLGIASLIAAVGVATAAMIMGALPSVALLAGLGLFAAIAVVSLALGFGQRAVLVEAGREDEAQAFLRLSEAAEARKRLAALRIADPELAAARDLLVLEAGRLVEDCRRAGTYDPEAVQAVVDAPQLVDAWLKEKDESSVERRFGLPDANPFPDAARRTAEALRAKAALVSARRAAAIGELPGADRIAIEEELK